MSSRSSSNTHLSTVPIPGYYRVGWVKSAHGIRGEVFIALFAGQADWLDNVKELSFLKPPQSELKPIAIEAARPHKNGLIVSLASVHTRNQSEALVKASVFVPETSLVSPPGETIFLNEIKGFRLMDGATTLGVISGFSSNGPQDLLVVQTETGEALVPFVDAFLVRLDFDKRLVHMDLPPGLFEIEGQEK